MPSGSHGGSGGGGHSFGSGGGHSIGSSGSHGGGGGIGYNSGRYRSGMYHGRTVIFFHGSGGRKYYTDTTNGNKLQSFRMIWLVLGFLFVISLFIFIAEQSTLSQIKQDYNYYQQMIADARSAEAQGDSSLFVTGVVKGKFQSDYAGKWYYTYEFSNTSNTIHVEGYTFAMYTFDEISKFRIGQDVVLAIDGATITEDTDSINLDYENIPLSRDGQWSQSHTIYIICIVAMIALALLAVLSVFRYVTLKKKYLTLVDEESGKSSGMDSTGTKQAKQDDSMPKYVVCEYCGNRVKTTEARCPHCGGSLPRK